MRREDTHNFQASEPVGARGPEPEAGANNETLRLWRPTLTLNSGGVMCLAVTPGGQLRRSAPMVPSALPPSGRAMSTPVAAGQIRLIPGHCLSNVAAFGPNLAETKPRFIESWPQIVPDSERALSPLSFAVSSLSFAVSLRWDWGKGTESPSWPRPPRSALSLVAAPEHRPGHHQAGHAGAQAGPPARGPRPGHRPTHRRDKGRDTTYPPGRHGVPRRDTSGKRRKATARTRATTGAPAGTPLGHKPGPQRGHGKDTGAHRPGCRQGQARGRRLQGTCPAQPPG